MRTRMCSPVAVQETRRDPGPAVLREGRAAQLQVRGHRGQGVWGGTCMREGQVAAAHSVSTHATIVAFELPRRFPCKRSKGRVWVIAHGQDLG